MASDDVTRSLWALPSATDAEEFSVWIARLAADTGSPPFAPHITIGATTDDHDDEIAAALAAFDPFTVGLIALDDSDARFRCITLLAEQASPIDDLRAALAKWGAVEPSEHAPHVSLLYAELPAAERAAVRATITLPLPRAVAVNTVARVDTTDSDPSRWSVERTWQL